MKDLKRIFSFSIGGWIIVVLGTLLLSLFSLADPFFGLREFFQRYGSTATYNFEYFGFIFTIWATSTFIPVSSITMVIPPLSLPSLFPFILLLVSSGILGYFLDFKKGISATFFLLIFGTIFGLILGVFVPFTIPTAGLSPEDQQAVLSLSDEFLKMTYLIPPNLVIELGITVSCCIGAVIIGKFIQKTLFDDPSKKKKRRKRK